jgi:hypothetical protein
MTPEELGNFLLSEQNISLDPQQLVKLIVEHEQSCTKQDGLLTLPGIA